MEASGTFISDLRAEVMAHKYFTEMPELTRDTEDLGIFMDNVAGPLLDYFLSELDVYKSNLIDRERLVAFIIMRHGIALKEILGALKPN